jgi:aspartyl-tRNA(Asn)/glutamyl-tRNA(Gln) amidotransferase subunit A
MRTPIETLAGLATQLERGEVTSRVLIEAVLDRLKQKPEQASKCFISVDEQGAKTQADEQDRLRKAGRHAGPYAGIPVSVKDLFDVTGQVTKAGSIALKNAAPATQDADAVAALRRAGMVIIGRTNMTEFAYSGLGLNPHYGTPLCIYDQARGRAPGGSSAGAAVSVAEGFNVLSIGSDTGGSCRIPAAYNGIIGFKPSAQRISTRGAYPLSSSFDSIGPFSNTVACAAAADAIMSGDFSSAPTISRISRPLRLAVLRNSYVMAGLDPHVEEDFARALAKLKASGVEFEDVVLDGLDDLPANLKRGGIVGYEAYQQHHRLLAISARQYDPRVSSRIQSAGETTAEDYQNLLKSRRALIARFEMQAGGFDGVVCPTVAIISPKLSDLKEDADYFRLNGVSLRNTYVANFLNGCSISLPMHANQNAPTGFMITAVNGADKALLASASLISAII